MSQPVVSGLPRVREHRVEQRQLEQQVREGGERVEGAYPEHGRTQRPLDHLDDRPRDERQKERPRREPRVVQGEARKQTAARLAAKVPRGGGGSIVRLMGRNWGGYGGGGG